jgi:flagellar biosynthesis GTPase FlhF
MKGSEHLRVQYAYELLVSYTKQNDTTVCGYFVLLYMQYCLNECVNVHSFKCIILNPETLIKIVRSKWKDVLVRSFEGREKYYYHFDKKNNVIFYVINVDKKDNNDKGIGFEEIYEQKKEKEMPLKKKRKMKIEQENEEDEENNENEGNEEEEEEKDKEEKEKEEEEKDEKDEEEEKDQEDQEKLRRKGKQVVKYDSSYGEPTEEDPQQIQEVSPVTLSQAIPVQVTSLNKK